MLYKLFSRLGRLHLTAGGLCPMRTRALMDYWQIDELLLGNNILKDNVNDQSVNTKHHDYDDNQTWNLSKKIHEQDSQIFKFYLRKREISGYYSEWRMSYSYI